MVEYVKLTTQVVEKISYTKGKQIFIRDSVLKGFVIRIGSKSKTYCIHKNVNGKFISKTIGKFGDISLKDARDKAREIINNIKDELPLERQVSVIAYDIAKRKHPSTEPSSPEEFITKMDVPCPAEPNKQELKIDNKIVFLCVFFAIFFCSILWVTVYWDNILKWIL